MKSVDVIIVTYNAEKFIAKTLDSILENKYAKYRIIVSDDNSIDETVGIVRRYQENHPGAIVLNINDINMGVTANANIALMICAADIIMFCGHDDYFYPDKINKCVDFFDSNPGVSLVYHDCHVLINGHIAMKFSETHTPREGAASQYLLHGCFSTATSVCVDGKLAREIKFNEAVKNTSDFLFFYEIAKRGYIKYIPEVLGAYIRHQNNLTTALHNREDFDSIKVGLHVLEHYKEDRLAALVNLNWTLLKLFSKNKKHLIFFIFSSLLSALWIVGQKIGKKRIR